MRLYEAIVQPVDKLNFANYNTHAEGQPPLDLSKIEIQTVLSTSPSALAMPIEGEATLALRYKEFLSAVSSLRENAAGEMWTIVQLQGAKSKKSFRVSKSLAWHKAFADRIKQYASHPDAAVERLAMPPSYQITNLTDSTNLEAAKMRYEMTIAYLRMQFSREEALYIVDVKKDTRRSMQDVLDN